MSIIKKEQLDFVRNSSAFKLFSIGFLILILLIPLWVVTDKINERSYRKQNVVDEISSKWGGTQIITGPFFSIPYYRNYTNNENKTTSGLRHLHILPKTLAITGDLTAQIRYRSIYEAVLYNAKIHMEGTFEIPELKNSDIGKEKILWNAATFSLGIKDLKGIKKNVNIFSDGLFYPMEPGLKTTDLAHAGIKSSIPISKNKKIYKFSFDLDLNGSGTLHFIPVGETTTLGLQSEWSSPGFNGAFLPTKRSITEKGFSADWKVVHLNRNFPQYQSGKYLDMSSYAFGVELNEPVGIYQKIERISKYAIMFIVFTFSAFFFAEVFTRKGLHPIQYLLVGLAIIIFYLLLLAFSEYTNFNTAYIFSALAITFIITGYTKGVMENNKFALIIFAILTILYSYYFIILQLEDYALLIGSVGLLLILSGMMFFSRKIDWYQTGKESNPENH